MYRNVNLPNETDTMSVSYTNAGTFSFTVPPGVTQMRVTLNGAGGWGGGSTPFYSGTGGRGGKVVCVINTTEGQQYEVGVGQGGAGGLRGKITYIKSGATYLAVAAAGGSGSRNGGTGGAGGATGGNGIIGINALGTSGGGATVNAGGAGGASGGVNSGQAGSALTGGIISTFNYGEGFGGDGWFGGGSSGSYNSTNSNPWASGGGGGGSNYIHASVTAVLNTNLGNAGGFQYGTGANGDVTIQWY